MAYPSSVSSFSTKVDHVTPIEAENINTLQTVVAAIEAGLLNGFEHHLKANGATRDVGTVASPFRDLHISGDADILGGINVAGSAGLIVNHTSTFGDDLLVSGDLACNGEATLAALSTITKEQINRLTYPIGSVYQNDAVATIPSDAAVLGFGTWSSITGLVAHAWKRTA